MNKLTVNPSKQVVLSNNSSIKLLIFEIGKLTLALPILQVQKVIKYQDVYGSGLSHVNLIHLEQQQVVVVNLHQKLFKTDFHQKSLTKRYFIISKTNRELLGITVSQSPTIIDVPSDRIRAIPETYRLADTLGIASHVAVIFQSQTPVTIFILDPEQLI